MFRKLSAAAGLTIFLHGAAWAGSSLLKQAFIRAGDSSRVQRLIHRQQMKESSPSYVEYGYDSKTKSLVPVSKAVAPAPSARAH